MKHQEAVEEMKKLAEGRAWSFTHEVASYKGRARISGYIDIDIKSGHAAESHTYAGAIENVKVMLGLVPCDPAPEDGDA